MTCRRRRALVAIGLLAAASIIGAPAFGQLELGGGHDANQPIEITADSLEVQQDKQLAIFRGTVDAVQGEMNLRADVLVVHYRAREDNQNSISLIEAEGNVFVSSPTEMAQGDRGIGVLITDHNVREVLDIVAHKDVRRVYLGDRFSL